MAVKRQRNDISGQREKHRLIKKRQSERTIEGKEPGDDDPQFEKV